LTVAPDARDGASLISTRAAGFPAAVDGAVKALNFGETVEIGT